MKKRYYQLRNMINVDIILLGEEIFNQEGRTSYSKEQQERVDNDWQVNPKLMSYIMEDMDPKYNTLEQISHIYLKLCYALRYSLGYHIRNWHAKYDECLFCKLERCFHDRMYAGNRRSYEKRCIHMGSYETVNPSCIIRQRLDNPDSNSAAGLADRFLQPNHHDDDCDV